MARSQRKASGATRGRYKRKRMGKGWSTARKEPIGTRPVLKITPEMQQAKVDKEQSKADAKAGADAAPEASGE